jgi:hypothetical protein
MLFLNRVVILFLPSLMIGKVPQPLGTSSSFAAVTNTGSSQITGNVGTNSGAVTGFGNMNGNIHTANATTA